MATTPITCHVLDTTTGRPAAGIYVRLSHTQASDFEVIFDAYTDNDGRVRAWAPAQSNHYRTVQEVVELTSVVVRPSGHSAPPMAWSLKFDTGAYFGPGQTFFPEVEVRFYVTPDSGEHFHVPLLLGPWSYTTYRGS
ncbi:MAG: hypothetical protein M4579_002155 [Chaenotheca gracillima]|nr:MAG: hypothetical protein M4579_002155 [Chaenotheca gracillima]